MITAEDVMKDYDEIMKDGKLDDSKKLLAMYRIILKLLLTMRTNQVLPEEEKKIQYNKQKGKLQK